MEKLLEILRSIKPDVDFENTKNLVEEGLLDSLELVKIIVRVSEEFDITIDGDDVDPENFQSVQALWNMIQRLEKSRDQDAE